MWCGFCVSGNLVRDPILIRKSMKLIKKFTEILREIISTGDEERFRRLEEIVRAYDNSHQDVENRFLH
jgi:hypothetical protein